jgi:hypothetical protein
MKKFVLTIAVLTLMSSPVLAQTESVGVFADTQALSCELTVPPLTLTDVYVIHRSAGASGSQFKVELPAGVTAAGGGVGNPSFLVIGDPYVDLALAYTLCLSGEIVVWRVTLFAGAAVPNCSYVSVVPAPTATGNVVISVDCNYAELPAYGGQGIISATASCSCNVATQESTWGKVKSLYR